MKDGTIILFKDENSKDFGVKLQYSITKSWVYHIAIYFQGKIYESGIYKRNGKIYNGIQDSRPLSDIKDNSIQIPLNDLSELEKVKMSIYLKNTLGKKYFWGKLILMIFIYPTRWFWNSLKWYPFKDYFFICSEYVDKVYKEIGKDLFPGRLEDFTVPGDYEKIEGFDLKTNTGE